MPTIGVVPYLNAVPLVADLPEEWDIRGADPAVLAGWLSVGAVDAALVPVALALRGVGDGWLGRYGIVSDGPVESVVAFLPRAGDPPEQWPARVVLDPASGTSVALLRVLLERRYGLRPRYEVSPVPGPDPRAHPDAIVLDIGDRALRRRSGWTGGLLDLGAEWKAWTGLPFVFARWTAREGLEPSFRASLARALDAAAERGMLRRDELAAAHGPAAGLSAEEARRYLRTSIRFPVDGRAEAGLARFAQELALLGG